MTLSNDNLDVALGDEGGSDSSSALSMSRIWGAFTHRWIVSVPLGLMLGAALAVAAWSLVPAHYTARAELNVKSVQNVIVFKTAEERARFETYKQTLMQLVRKPVTLIPALEEPGVADSQTVRESPLRPLDFLAENLVVKQSGAEFFEIALSGEHPEELAKIVNTVKDTFLVKVVGERARERRRRLEYLNDAKLRQEESIKTLRESLRANAKIVEAATSTDASGRQQALWELQLQIRKELAEIEFNIIQLEVESELVKKSDEGENTSNLEPDVVEQLLQNDPSYVAARDRADRQRQLLADYERVLDPENSRVEEQRRLLEEAEARLDETSRAVEERIAQAAARMTQRSRTQGRDQLDAQLERLRAHRTRLQSELVDQGETTRELGTLSFEMKNDERELASSEALLDHITDQIAKLKIENGAAQEFEEFSEVTEVRPADVPYRRDRKKQMAATALGGLGGCGLVVAFFTFLELRRQRIRCVQDIPMASLGTHVVGAIPQIPAKALRRRESSGAGAWQSAFSEAIDSIRTLLLSENDTTRVKSILVTSALNGEGKTTVASHLALSLARAGRAVLLVDCDTRRPSVDRVFDVPLIPGFCEALNGDSGLDEVLHPLDVPNLWVTPAGLDTGAVHQLLSRDAATSLFDRFKQRFDFVVVDSSPVLPVTDTLLLSKQVDGVVFTLRKDVSRVSQVQPSIDRLKRVSAPLLGLIVSGVTDEHYRYTYDANLKRERSRATAETGGAS